MKTCVYARPEVPELTESERAALSGLTLGQRIHYHTQRQRNWMVDIDEPGGGQANDYERHY
jgi:hypothetical protein